MNPMPVKSVNELTEVDIIRLAREIARDLKPLDFILQHLGIAPEAFEKIKDSDMFAAHLMEEAAVWAGSNKATLRERVSLKAAAAVEELLLEAVGIVQDTKLGGEARIKALQFLAKIGQLENANVTKEDGSGRVTINIQLGNQKLSFDKESEPKTIEGSAIVTETTPGVNP